LHCFQINTAIGDQKVIAAILDTMRLLEDTPSPAGVSLRGVALK
jgi:hypothetical protein